MGTKVMGYRQSQSVGCGLTDWDWIDSSKKAYGLSWGDGFYRGRPMDGSHAFTSKQGQAFLTPGRSRWPMMLASG